MLSFIKRLVLELQIASQLFAGNQRLTELNRGFINKVYF